jgi:type I restriction enzyme S subunit
MIGDYVDILSGYAFNSAKFNDEGKGLPIVRIRDVGKDRVATYFEGDYSNDFLLKNGDFLIGMDGDFRLAEWKGGEALLNQRVCKITPNEEKINGRYLLFLLPKELKEIEDTTSFATVKHLSVKKIKNIQIPLPPLETQKKIAAILDAADGYRQKTKALIAKYNELTQSLFLDMFGDPVRNEKGWELRTLKSCTSKIGSGSTPRGGKEAYHEEGISLIRSLNIYDNVFKYKNLAFINDEQAYKLKNVTVESEDVLFNITGASVCRSTIVPDDVLPARVNQHVSILRTKREILTPIFLSHLLISENTKRFLLGIGSFGGAVMEAITKEQLENFKVIVPPIVLQNQFAVRVQKIEVQKAHAQQSLEKAEELFNSLLQRAFKGEL